MKNATWMQLSDIHIFESTDWNIMQNGYKELSNKIKIDFLVVTGDFRHKLNDNSFDKALKFLNKIVRIFGLNKKDVFFVPGNHDVNDYLCRKEIISYIRQEIDNNPDVYLEYMHDDEKSLKNGFTEYNNLIKNFYGDKINDERVRNPSDIFYYNWDKKLNLIFVNSALISDASRSFEIIDVNKLSEMEINKNCPTIIFAHHKFDSLSITQQKQLKKIFKIINVKAYICGDRHKISKTENIEIGPGNFVPVIISGKSALETTDTYSDLSVIVYSCDYEITKVQVYRYNRDNMSFIKSSDFYYEIDQEYRFSVSTNIAKSHTTRIIKKSSIDKPISIWLPDAEMAQGKQTRFNSFTNTDVIEKFLKNDACYLGISSVKGIGKTFVLQVKRVTSSRKYYCLPLCRKPSQKNNWATERVSFDSYAKFKTENIYDDLVFLWKLSIECYVINNLKNKNELNIIKEQYRNNRINKEIQDLCLGDHFSSLNTIVNNLLSINKWNTELKSYHTNVMNLCNIILTRRENELGETKDIAVFIDKVDQAVKQTNAEPPADCILCGKDKNYDECKSSKKCMEYCSNDNGCQSKNCCFGCELYSNNKGGDGLRLYNNLSSKLIHINIWQYLQLALMNAANQIYEEFFGRINVFYTIRQEAFNCEQTLFGEQNQKITGKVLKLSYTVDEQKRIFYDCIKEQDTSYLLYPDKKNDDEEYAFIGVNSLCHPYCKNPDGEQLQESVFQSIYRHSFDRSRDIQRYGEALTNHLSIIANCSTEKARGEKVKEIIENLAATLAYCSKETESTANPSYYTEKLRYLPNYWADNENFEKLISLIDRNLMFVSDLKNICKIFNDDDNCQEECMGANCKHHPFTMLHHMGYLGIIRLNKNNENKETQEFLDSSEIGYFDEHKGLLLSENCLFVLHPALTKTIEKNYNKEFKHFSGFILGKGLPINRDLVIQMLDDKKFLNEDMFLNKYYVLPQFN